MGASSYNRGTRKIARDADERMTTANARADRQAHADENARLRAQVTVLESDLRRALRCLAAERLGRELLARRLAAAESAHAFAVSCLCKRAFPEDKCES
jgi:hypothetical protein